METAQRLLTYSRVAMTLFVVLFVMSWQRLGPPDPQRLLMIAGICLGFIVAIHLVLWSIELCLSGARWLAHHGRDRLAEDASGARTGRYTLLFRVVLPFSLFALAGSLAGGPGIHLAVTSNTDMALTIGALSVFLSAMLALTAATHLMSFRFRFDQQTVSVSKMLMGHKTHYWSDLEAVGTGPVAGDMILVFRDGRFIRIPRYCEGHNVIADYALKRLNRARTP